MVLSKIRFLITYHCHIRSNAQQEEAVRLLEHLQLIHTTAKEAVALGDGTLKEANNTYHILAGFQNQVQQSSESAKLALATVPGIEQQILDAQKTVEEAESVSEARREYYTNM